MIFITQEDEIKLQGTQAIYFYSFWMAFHQKMMIMLDLVEKKCTNIVLFAVDVDDFKSQCKRFSIRCVPTVVILQEGKEISRIEGFMPTKVFADIFTDICNL